MALVRRLGRIVRQRNRVHEEVECGYLVFERDGITYLQLDTYGRPDRMTPGKVSQSLQFDAEAARQLVAIIRQTFPQ